MTYDDEVHVGTDRCVHRAQAQAQPEKSPRGNNIRLVARDSPNSVEIRSHQLQRAWLHAING